MTNHRFIFPVQLTPDDIDGGWVVTCRDLPEAITQGDTIELALSEATDCLEEAIALRIDDKREIPTPSSPLPKEYTISIPLQTALKAALYLAMQETQVTPTELASRLNVNEKEVRRILDPRYQTKLPIIEETLQMLGKQIELRVVG